MSRSAHVPRIESSGGIVGEVPSADGVAVGYEVHGRGAPAVVFVHGWSCDRRYWHQQAFSGTLTNGASRHVDVTFRPATNAILRRTLVVTSTTSGSPDVITMSGKGPGGF